MSLKDTMVTSLNKDVLTESTRIVSAYQFDDNHPSVVAFNNTTYDMRVKRADIFKSQGNQDAHDFQMELANEIKK